MNCVYIRQAEALGLGHAVLCAKPVVGRQPFAVVLADDLIENGQEGALSQMVTHFNEHRCSILGVERVPEAETCKYGIVKPQTFAPRLSRLEAIVEKA